MSQLAPQPRVRRLTKPTPKPVKVTGGQLQRNSAENKPSSPIEKTPEAPTQPLAEAQPKTEETMPKVGRAVQAKKVAGVRKPRVTKPRGDQDSQKTDSVPVKETVAEQATQATATQVEATGATSAAAVPPAADAKKRSHNTRPTAQDISGIGIAPPRVKYVLVSKCLNPQEVFAKNAINQAERPARVGDAEPVPVPIAHLGEEILSVIREAEREHEQNLRSTYEKRKLKALKEKDPDEYKKYDALLSATRGAQGAEFNLRQFNSQYNTNFYADFEAFKLSNDPYVLGAKVSQQALRTQGQPRTHNQWSRAASLINRSCIRLSVNTRNILAIFLDKLVEEYAENGMLVCAEQQCSPVHLRHALTNVERVAHDRFVSTFDSYKQAVQWIGALQASRAACLENRKTNPQAAYEPPIFPVVPGAHEFFGYVSEVCRSVKLRLARHAETEAQKNAYLSISLTREFRLFCSNMVYEAIMRVGSCLRQLIKWNGTKTINDSLVYHVLEQMHSCMGVAYEPVKEQIEKRLKHHTAWRSNNKKLKKPKAVKGTAVDPPVEQSDQSTDDQSSDDQITISLVQ